MGAVSVSGGVATVGAGARLGVVYESLQEHDLAIPRRDVSTCGQLLDVRRDPRVALHRPTIEPPTHDLGAWPGDAKLAGTLVETIPPAGDPDGVAGPSSWTSPRWC